MWRPGGGANDSSSNAGLQSWLPEEVLLVRDAVKALVAAGPMPSEDDEDSDLENWEKPLLSLKAPLSDEEADALIGIFPPDLAFGLGFTLLHLVESAPGWGLAMAARIQEKEWRERAEKRLRNAGRA